MKISLTYFLLLLPFGMFAQSFSGLYKPVKKSHDPQGGAVFFITEDNHWGAMAFGTALYGTIEKLNDSLLVVARLKPTAAFSIYARYDSTLGDSTRMFMSDFSSGQYLIHFEGETELPKVRRVFAPNANGFAYPYVAKFEGIKYNISIAKNEGYKDEEYQFFNYENKLKHNDFVILNHSEVYYDRDYIMVCKDSFLHKMGEKSTGFKKVSEVNKQVSEMNEYLSINITYPDTVFYSRLYKSIGKERLAKEDWYYQTKGDYYSKTKDGQELIIESETDYNNPRKLFPYITLRDFTESTSKAIIEPAALFKTSMEDDQ